MKNGILSFAGAVLLVPFAAAEAQVAAPDTAAHGVVFSSLERATASQPEAIAGSARLSFTLAGDAFDKTIEVDAGLWRPIDFVPSSVTVESLTFVFPSATESGVPATVTVGGVTYNRTGSAEAVTLAMADGTLTAYAHTFAVAQGTDPLRVATGTPCAVTFPGNVSSSLYRLEGGNVHVRVSAVADTLTRHVVTIADGGTVAFSALGLEGYEDTQDTVVVVNFAGQGGTLTLDEDVSAAALVLASGVEGAGLAFGAGVALTGPMTLRDGDAAEGGLTLSGTAAGWDPKAFTLGCDLTLKAVLPAGGWFAENTLTIPAGRTFRVEHAATETVTEDNLPKVAFGDAASRLVLASETGAAIPDKYKALIQTQSGTLVLDRAVTETGPLTLTAQGATALTLVLAGGHGFTVEGDFAFSGYDDLAIVQEGGTFAAGTLTLGANANTFTVAAGATATLDTFTVPTARSTAAVDVAGTLTLADGLDAGADASGAVNLTVSGTLTHGGDLNMTPAGPRTLTLDGGTLAATGTNRAIVCGAGASETDAVNFIVTAKGGTVTGDVTVTAVTGGGSSGNPEATTLTFADGAAVGTLSAFTGVVKAPAAGAIQRIAGNSGVVVADFDGSYLKTALDVVDADYGGVFGLTAGTQGAVKEIDFSALAELTEVPWTFRVDDYQHIVIRLDQYADARFRWPDPPTEVSLTLIESGAYGGTVTIPHVPNGVDFTFAYYDVDKNNAVTERTEGFRVVADENGVTDTLTWEDPVFTGAGAWFDVEFDGSSKNTGWFTLLDNAGTPDDRNNGMLRGDAADADQTVMTDPSFFFPVAHPENDKGGLPLRYRPYVSPHSLDYPDQWSVAVRIAAPKAGKTCILALGGNGNYEASGASDQTYALVFATGETPNEIVLWKFDGKGSGNGDPIGIPDEPLFRVELADAQTALHVFSVVCDGTSLTLYMDGAYLNQIALPPGTHLAPGLQVGQQLGGIYIPSDAREVAQSVEADDGGLIDYIRFYKGALNDAAMQEMADRTPYVRENLRYVREVPAKGHTGAETWIQEGAWQEQTWDGTKWVNVGNPVAQPAEGAECRLLVAPDEHVIQVNVAVDRDNRFYSPNRNYSALVIAPLEEGQTEAGTVRLTPFEVTVAETAEGWEAAVIGSTWMTKPAAEGETANNHTGFHYGRIRFTGGAEDPITDDPAIPDFHGAAYVLSGESTVSTDPGDVTWDTVKRTSSGGGWWYDSGTYTQTATRTKTVTYTANDSMAPMKGIVDAGACVLSKYADVTLKSADAGTVTYTETYTLTGTYESRRGGNHTYEPNLETFSEATLTGTTSENNLQHRVASVNTLRVVAGMSLTRGERAEAVTWQLTGPVVVEGAKMEADDLGQVEGNTALEASSNQNSLDVWVPAFGSDASWKFYDVTRKEATANENGRGTGLFAQGIQTPGRLYLDLTAPNGSAGYGDGEGKSRDFSQQKWYRYGYENMSAGETLSGMAPVPISPTDYNNAVAFQIRLSTELDDVKLTLGDLPDSEIATFYVEDDATGEADAPTLTLTSAGDPLTVHDSVIAAARLDISNKGGKDMALDLKPEGTPIPVHKGTSGHGALIVGNATLDWDFGAISSVPRLEVAEGCTLTLSGDQDFTGYGNTLAAQKGATLAQVGGAATLDGTDLILGAGATFSFQAEASADNASSAGVHFSGAIILEGDATLSASAETTGGVPHIEALGEDGGGIQGTGTSTLTVHSGAGTVWHSHTAALKGIAALVKTGAGTVDFYANTPPTVAGPVTVSEGKLAVAKAANTPIGAGGLHVEKDATLADNGLFDNTGAFLAAILDGKTLSGGGTVEGGRVRLAKGAIYQAAKDEALIVTDGLDPEDHASGDPDIRVLLPEGYEAREPFLVSGRVEPDTSASVPNVRRRLRSAFAGGTVWDTLAEVDPTGPTTTYSAQEPGLPVPDHDGNDPNAYGKLFRDAMTDGYRNEGHGLVARAEGYTKAGTEYLLAPAIEGAVTCFGNVMTYQRDATSSSATYFVDGVSLCVAYEFGIAAMREVTRADGSRWLALRVEVRNALADAFPDRGLPADVLTRNAEFREGVAVTFHRNGESAPIQGVERVADLDGTPLTAADATIGRRFYLVPAEALRPGDTLTARAALAPESATP